MNKETYFVTKLEEIQKQCKIKYDIFAHRDNRLKGIAAEVVFYTYTDGQHEECFIIKYNMNQLNRATKIQILTVIGHELGHIKLKHYKRKLDLYNREYEAENYAFDMIKKYYSKYYKKALRNLKRYSIYDNVYGKVFSKVLQERVRQL